MTVLLLVASIANPFQLHILPESSSDAAACLDGSRPGYYWRAGSGADRHNFKLHLMGGNWCMSGDDCLARSRGFLGSSRAWPAQPPNGTNGTWDLGVVGLMGNHGGRFENWTAVWVMYCDGTSFAAHR